MRVELSNPRRRSGCDQCPVFRGAEGVLEWGEGGEGGEFGGVKPERR
jgi:hypothetical protein